jgi:hypothetical protein
MDYTPIIDSRTLGASYQYPSDRIPGCLPRRSRPGDWCPMAAERIEIIPRNEWAEYARNISLRPHVHEVLDQDGVGSCATEATAGAIMIARSMHGLEHVTLNPWFIYYKTSGGRDRGSSIDENLAFAREHGCAPESVWSRDKGWRTRPSEEAYEAAKQFRIEEFYDITSIDEMVSCLLAGYPVVYGSNGHAVCKVAHLDESKGLDLNSWGTGWEDDGFGVWASYRAVNWAYGAWAVRVATQA